VKWLAHAISQRSEPEPDSRKDDAIIVPIPDEPEIPVRYAKYRIMIRKPYAHTAAAFPTTHQL